MPIVCQCNVIMKAEFLRAVDEQAADAPKPFSPAKAAGMAFLATRSISDTPQCLGNCHQCLPALRKIVEEHRQAAIPVRQPEIA